MTKIEMNENKNSSDFNALFETANKESDFAEKIFNTVRESLLLLDKDLRVIKASRSFYNFFKVTSSKTIGKLIYDLGNRQWNIPKLRELLETILSKKKSFDNYEVEHVFPKIGKRIMLLNARKIPRGLSEEQMILLAIEDITERKLKEESLSEKSRLTNEYLEILINHAHVPIIIWDSSREITRINQEFEKLIGYNWDELRGKKIDFLFSKENIDSTLELIENILSDKKIEVIETNLLTKDKNIKTVIWNSANILDKEGKSIVATIAQDITYLKKAEEVLIESERLFHSLAQVSPVGIFKTNADGYTTYVNPKWSLLSGLSIENAIGFNWLRAVHPEDRKKLSKGWLESTKAQKASYSEYRFLHPDGTVVWVMGQATPELDSENKIIGYIGTITDITERKLTEMKLQESETRYHRLHDSITDGFVQTKMSGEIVDINRSFLEMIGYSKNELLKLRYQDITPARWHEFETRIVNEQILPRGYSDVYEKEYIKKDGTVLPVELKTYLLHDTKGNNSHFWALVRDITKRKQAEEALKESEERFRSLYENSTIGLYRTTPGGKIILANATLVKMLGYSSFKELAERNLEENGFEPSYERKLFLEQIERDGEVKGLESAWTSKDGLEVFLRESAKAICDANGRTLYYDGTVEDITERKMAEAALSESEISFRTLSDSGQALVWTAGTDKLCNYFNKVWLQFTGRSLEQEMGNGWTDGVHSDDMQRCLNIYVSAFDLRERFSMEYRLRRYDGEYRWILDDGSPRYNSKGEFAGYIGHCLDITERKRAEEEVLILAQSLKSIHECVSITDLEDKIIFVNESFLKTYGYSESEIFGKNMNIVRSRNNPPEIIKEILPATLKGRWSGELWNKRKDGSEFPIYLSTTVINDKDGKTLGLIGVASDITEQKRSEKELIKAKEKAEESDKLKSEFLAQMSHEIRTPINVMIGNVDYLHQSFNEKMDPDTRDCFEGIELASKRIIRTIDLILDAAQLQTSDYKPKFAEIDLNSEILDKLSFGNQLLATQKGLVLVYKCVIKETIILADEYSVTQIFANLIDNAIKYTKKGKIEILLGNHKTGKIMVEIKDTGIGINKDFLPRIFEPFAQEEQGYTRSFEGNGLGLALVKKYCEINKATIEVESKKYVGTTFRVIFS